MNQLYRSNTNKMISGVCGGVADYLSINPDLVRAIFVIGTIASELKYGFIVYVVAMLLIPIAPPGFVNHHSNDDTFSFDGIKNKNIIGLALIFFGIILTFKRILHIDDIVVISIILISLGIYLISKGGKK